MTLFIACLIISGLGMNPWLYAVAVVFYGAHVATFWLAYYRIYEDVREVGHYAREAERIAGNIYERG